MTSALVVVGGTETDQQVADADFPPLNMTVASTWLADQPEYRQRAGMWISEGISAEIYLRVEADVLRCITFMYGSTGAGDPDRDLAHLKRRLQDLAQRLGVRVYDDEEEGFLAP